jgi:DNA-binding CsgD family transcriptional regulator
MRAMAASTRSALDRLAFGVILVDAGLRARVSNAAAEEILNAGDGLSLRQGRLAAARPTETRALEALLAGAVRTGQGGGLHPGGAMALPRPSGRMPLAVTVAPLPRRPGVLLRDAGDARPVAVLFVADPERRPTEPARRIRQLYRLTQREAQLVGILIAGRGLESAADEMGIAREAARGYLKRIFEKTGTSRQGELVALVLRGLTPTL